MPEEINSPNESGDDEGKQRKRKERLEQNRISARESRKRKKTMIEELQRTVITLSRENKELNERNEGLRRQLMELGAKYPNIVPMQAIMGAAPQAVAAPAGDPMAGPVPAPGMFFLPHGFDPSQLAQAQQAQAHVVQAQQAQAQQAAAPVATGETKEV